MHVSWLSWFTAVFISVSVVGKFLVDFEGAFPLAALILAKVPGTRFWGRGLQKVSLVMFLEVGFLFRKLVIGKELRRLDFGEPNARLGGDVRKQRTRMRVLDIVGISLGPQSKGKAWKE